VRNDSRWFDTVVDGNSRLPQLLADLVVLVRPVQ
jgi:hypothetical protein